MGAAASAAKPAEPTDATSADEVTDIAADVKADDALSEVVSTEEIQVNMR